MVSGEESSSSRNDSFPIKTVVVLVQENRSFDHMLGWFKSLNPEINGVTGSESNPVSTSDSNSSLIYFGDNAPYVDPDPGHSIQAIYEQVFGKPWTESDSSNPTEPTMNGFVQNAELTQKGMGESVMRGFRPDDLPVYKQLVSNFGICDRWFASVPASTQPNRMYVHSATSHGASSNNTEKLIQGFPQKTIFESLEESGFSFGIYYQFPPATLFYRNLRKLKYLDNFHQFDLSFKKHCEEGKLPNYVVIEQRYWNLLSIPANDDHPSHDVSEGQKFVKQVYEALRSSPQWNEMLLIITYDEHGGFYDHVPTPTNVPSPDDIVGYAPFYFKFDRLGVRVPTFFVSPWIEPGTILHGPSGPQPNSEFEHSSIPATVKKIFNLKDFLTKRDAWAGTFEGVITRDNPRTDCPVTLPEVRKKLLLAGPNETASLSEFQQELVQMAAVLKGDHMKDIYPDKLVEQMTVAEGANYVEEALKTFWGECKKAKEKGANDHEILVLEPKPTPRSRTTTSFAQRIFSCLICDN